jgi:acetyl esterase
MVELKRPLTTIVAALACLTLGLPADAAPPIGEPVVYKTVGDRELTLYVTRPDDWQSGDRRPCIVFFHGGGWVGGQPGQFTEHARHFSGRGLVCVQVEYRLLGRRGNDPPDACIHDARSAMRWVRSHADRLGIDPLRIASAGGSAGGHLAAHVGTVDGLDDPQDNTAISCKSQAMLLFNPVFDNGPGGWGTQRVGERYPEISPLHNISPDDPPAVVFLGTEDKLIPVATGRRFEDEMHAAGVACRLPLYEGQPHGFFNHGRDGNRWYNETIATADKFLESLGWLDAGS